MQQVSSARCTARRSSSLPGLCRWCSTARSFSSRPCGTATISSRSKPTIRRRTRLRQPKRIVALSAGLLLVSLVAVVGLAKVLTPTVEFGIAYLGVPKAVVGIVIAALVLLPEALAAVRAARNNRLQTSLNLALGSALATIGLTIPAVAAISIVLGQPLELGLDGKVKSCWR